ncbi:hypothetical protein [Halalkalibacter okhensis]|uniref:hypothetical protein n=1 Tax=Halalkalibacter okhensis TaxID=333138 RepID=UPI001269A23C|nr:hypothetical protein [Halalkalibacter okhensis]
MSGETLEWFVSNCIYTSIHDPISKILMFDVDGDDSLIVNDNTIVEVAERNVKNVVPLDYELASAKPDKINEDNIYDSLISAYSKNMSIGDISNNISKVWNSDVWQKGTDEEQEEALKVIKWLVFENNACIDFAKSLWMPERPPEVNETIKKYTSGKVAYFFMYAKDKKRNQVADKNESVMSRLDNIIPNTGDRVHFEENVVDDYDYLKLMHVESRKIDTPEAEAIIDRYEKLNKGKHWDIQKEAKLQGKSMNKVKFRVIRSIKDELLKINDDIFFVTDVLVKYLYEEKESANKDTLWDALGHVIIWNLRRNIQGLVKCFDCANEIQQVKQRQVRCVECNEKRKKEKARERQRKRRMKQKM